MSTHLQERLGEPTDAVAPLAKGQRIDAAEPFMGRRPCANVLGVHLDAIGMERALRNIEASLKARRKGFICMAGVHGIMEAQRHPEVMDVYEDSYMTLPDGMPTVWVGRLQGHQSMRRVSGPDMMLEMFRQRRFDRYSHFFYGGKPGVAEELAGNLSHRFPWARIAGTYTPPFRNLTPEEERRLISTVRGLQPSIIWVGISTPRQELFMRRFLPLLDTTLMFGVGAAFDFHTGRIKDCQDWIKRAGLQWLHRMIQDPRHLFWRYARNNPSFLWRMALQFAGASKYNRRSLPRSQEENADCEGSPDLCS